MSFACFLLLSTLIFAATYSESNGDENLHEKHLRDKRSKPNVIIFNADDMGYGDLSSYGHPTQEWGAIDDLTREGMKFNNMVAAASLCSPSRAALLTGRYGQGGTHHKRWYGYVQRSRSTFHASPAVL